MREHIEPARLEMVTRIIGAVQVALGLVFIAGGCWWIHNLHLDLFLTGSTIEGHVIENRAEQVHGNMNSGSTATRSMGGVAYRAVVQFATPEGQSVTFDDYGFNPPSFQVGQKVNVFYDPRNPQAAMVDRGTKNLIVPAICALVGFLTVLGGVQRFVR